MVCVLPGDASPTPPRSRKSQSPGDSRGPTVCEERRYPAGLEVGRPRRLRRPAGEHDVREGGRLGASPPQGYRAATRPPAGPPRQALPEERHHRADRRPRRRFKCGACSSLPGSVVTPEVAATATAHCDPPVVAGGGSCSL